MTSRISFVNYVVSWTLPSFRTNLVEMEMFFDAQINSGSSPLEQIELTLYDKRFGLPQQGSIQIFRDNSRVFGQTRFFGNTFSTFFPLDPPMQPGTTEHFKVTFSVSDALCSVEGDVGIMGTWASMINNYAANVEYDIFVPKIDADENPLTFQDIKLSFSPFSGRSVVFETDDSFGRFIPYSRGQLDMSTGGYPNEVFFTWNEHLLKDEEFSIEPCERFILEISPGGLLLGVAMLIFVSVAICATLYGFVSRGNENGFYSRIFFGTSVLIPESRQDLIVAPGANHTTVRAVLEDDDPVHSEIRLNTIEIGVNNVPQVEGDASL